MAQLLAVLILVLTPWFLLAAPQQEGELLDVFSDTSPNYVQPVTPVVGKDVALSIRTSKGQVERVRIRVWDKTERFIEAVRVEHESAFYDYWVGTYRITDDQRRWYRFLLTVGEKQYQFNSRGLAEFGSTEGDFILAPGFSTPAWVPKSVFYQIFPDRFRDGDPSNNVAEDEYVYGEQKVYTHAGWTELPEYQVDFFGGDLAGIEQQVPYLRDLGIDALYLNPVFESRSNHKYDTLDYDRIDPHFGTNAQFTGLMTSLHKGPKPMRIVLDAVFNHTGETHRWFDRHGEHAELGAFESKESPFASFYLFRSWPDDYLCWWGYKTLPKLNFDAPALRAEVFGNGNSSIMGRWIAERGIDGWRLDVPNDLNTDPDHTFAIDNHELWRQARATVKKANPEALITGEIWTDGSPWLQGDQFDSLMNYHGFTHPLSRILNGFDCTQENEVKSAYGVDDFALALTVALGRYPYPAVAAMLNSLSTHDIPRFLRRTTKLNRWHKTFNSRYLKTERPELFRLALVLQMTFVGAPMVYYGDEVGVTGGVDPDNRRTFDWNWKTNAQAIEFHTLHKELIALRKSHPVLVHGSFVVLAAERSSGVLAYTRASADQEEQLVVVLNTSSKHQEVRLPLHRLDLGTAPRLQPLHVRGAELNSEGTVLVGSLAPHATAVYSVRPTLP